MNLLVTAFEVPPTDRRNRPSGNGATQACGHHRAPLLGTAFMRGAALTYMHSPCAMTRAFPRVTEKLLAALLLRRAFVRSGTSRARLPAYRCRGHHCRLAKSD